MNPTLPSKTHLPASLTLRFGDIGDYVELIQNRLVELSLLQPEQVNGEYDERTSGAVKHFQGLNGLNDDAVVGPKTAKALKLVEAVTASEDNAVEEEIAAANEEELEAARLREEMALQQEAERIAEEELLKEENLVAIKNKEAGEAKQEAKEEVRAATAAPPPNPFAKKENSIAATEKLHEKHEAMEEMLEGQQSEAPQVASAPPRPEPPLTLQDMQTQQVPDMPQAHAEDAIILDGAGFEALQARIEAKLDQPTLSEVKVTGSKLAAAGIKESVVPAELDIGKTQTPALAQQEQKQMEIG